MTREDILRMAREADCLDPQHHGSDWVDKLEKLADLIEQHVKQEAKDKLMKWASYEPR